MKQFYAYIHRRPDGTAFYVGKGCGRRAFDMRSRNQHHKRIVAQIGKENVTVEVLLAESEAHALLTEAALIRIMKRHGYSIANLTDGGEHGPVGYRHTPESKEKIRLTSIGRKHMVGKKPSSEALEKLRVAAVDQWRKIRAGELGAPKRKGTRVGYASTPETRSKMVEAWKYRAPVSDATKAKISASLTGHKRTPEECKAISERQKGRTYSEETRQRMRLGALRRYEKQDLAD